MHSVSLDEMRDHAANAWQAHGTGNLPYHTALYVMKEYEAAVRADEKSKQTKGGQMTRAERVAHGLILKHGSDAYWVANRRVIGWLCDGTAPERVTFWARVRSEVRDIFNEAAWRIGVAEVWI